MNEEELNKEMVEFAGFKRSNDHLPENEWDFYLLYGETNPQTLIRPILARGMLNKGLNFTKSLDACFKWLVPKIRERGLLLELNDMKPDWHWDIWKPKGTGEILACEDDEHPALALCLAIAKLLEARNGN